MDCFYLGTHRPYWLWDPAAAFPLFVSHHTLCAYASLRTATCGWALDSGGFTELSQHGRWRTTPAGYVRAVARYDTEIGSLEWAAPMDWMCEPEIIHGGGRLRCPGSGLSVEDHQQRTVANFLELTGLWPQVSDTECPFMPVLQGRPGDPGSYLHCAALYEAAGVRLFDQPVVGVGSVCRIQATSRVRLISDALASIGLGPAARTAPVTAPTASPSPPNGAAASSARSPLPRTAGSRTPSTWTGAQHDPLVRAFPYPRLREVLTND